MSEPLSAEKWNESTTSTEGVPVETTSNTAAVYVRRSAFDADNTEADAFSKSLAAQERECLAWAEHQGVCELGLLSADESY